MNDPFFFSCRNIQVQMRFGLLLSVSNQKHTFTDVEIGSLLLGPRVKQEYLLAGILDVYHTLWYSPLVHLWSGNVWEHEVWLFFWKTFHKNFRAFFSLEKFHKIFKFLFFSWVNCKLRTSTYVLLFKSNIELPPRCSWPCGGTGRFFQLMLICEEATRGLNLKKLSELAFLP